MFSVESSVVKTLAQDNVRVLAMKLQLPLLPLDYVKRNSLMELFEKLSMSSRVFFLQAAPGYGKSLTLAQWLHQKKQQKAAVAWLSLDPKENEPERFILYLLSSIHSAYPDLAFTALAALKENLPLENVFLLLVNDLVTNEQAFHLAFDDVHHLHDTQVLDWLDTLVNQLPDNNSIYFTSREESSLVTARLVSQKRIAVLDEQQLVLSALEISDWLALQKIKHVTLHKVEQLHNLTEGWVTGLRLIQQVHPELEVEHIEGDESLLNAYFEQEFFPHIELTDREVCNSLSILKCANWEYIQYVFPQENISSILTHLNKRHVFVRQHPQKNSWYQLHPMLNAVLLHKQSQDYLTAAYTRAGEWLHKYKIDDLAVDMALRSGDKKQAANYLQISAENILEDQDIAQLLSWKQQLPDEIITASPRLVIIFSWTLAFAQQLDEAERLMSQMDRFILPGGSLLNDEMSGQLFAIRAYISRVRGKIDNALYLCHQALEKLPQGNYVARAVTYFNLSNVYMTQDKVSKAREYNRLSFETARAAGSIHLEMLALHELARIEQVKGNLNLSEKLLDEGLLLADKLKNKETAAAYGRLLTYKGYIVWLQNKELEGEKYLKEGLQVSERCHDSYIIMAYVVLCNIERQRDHLEQAYDLLALAEAQLQRWSVPSFVFQPWLSTMRTNLLIDQGKHENALANIKSLHGLLVNNAYALSPEHYPALRGLVDVFYVRVKSISGHHKEALKLLDKKLEGSNQNQQGFALVFIYLMRALLRHQLGQEDEAIQDFRNAINLAEDDNCIMPFIEYSAGMSALYNQLPNAVKEKAFVQNILQNLDISETESRNEAFAQIRMVISSRELAVLQLIAQGLSNQEIAERLFISLHTVKTHARRINSKLMVKSRTQAIIKAREMGVI